ncbi:MAG TPA: protease complex subunit PrcB family protein [Solirubrobacteraceae bacterium]|nr:protease complex subunit PrcB family protein [Solirubrobacteraceae bacterium]
MLVVALVTIVGPSGRAVGDAAAASGNVAFNEVVQGTRDFNLPAERMQASARVVRSATQAARQLRAWGIDARATAGIDFARQSAIVVLAAYQPTGGYRARISKVAALGRIAVVTAQVRYEGGEVAAASITRPWVVVAVKRSALAGVRGAPLLRLR